MQNDKTLLADFGSKTSLLESDKTGFSVSTEADSPAIKAEIVAQVNSQNPLHKNIQICNASVSDKMEIAKQIKHSRVDIISQSKPSCVFLNTYYNKFLEDHYAADPQLMSTPYARQLISLQESFFGDSDFYSRWMAEAGLNAEDIIINCQPLQQTWARENNFSGQGLNIAVEQIRRKKPQAVYIQDLSFAGADFLAAIRPHTKLIVGQIASPVPPQADLSSFDIIFSSFPHFVERFRKMGITSYYQPLAFDKRVLDRIGNSPKTYPVTFIGGMSPTHCKGQQILEDLSRLVQMDFWGYGAENLPSESIIRKRHHGQIWGMEMFSALQKSFITINRHIDVAENNANNMRLFEATGCGAMLITDYKDNLNELFEIGKEVVAYRSPEEAAALVKYYLQNPKEAEEVALAGQRRTLRDHTYEKRMSQTAEILERHLRYKREKNRFPAPDMSKIASVPKSIDSSEVTSELTSAWQDKDIPARQRALTQQELNAMYKGSQPQIYNILADILRPYVATDSTLLEIGCATGYYYEILEYLLNKRISYTGVDYSEALISMAKDFYPKTEFIAADGANLPFEDGQFSIAISSCMLLHVPNYAQHIAETARVAGQFVVAHRTPVCRQRPTQYYKKLAYGIETVELRFNENEIISEFASYGLKLINGIEYYTKPNADEFEATYLFQKVAAPLVKSVGNSTIEHMQKDKEVCKKTHATKSFKCEFKGGPVVLISTEINFTFPLSYAYLAGYLKERGIDVRILFKGSDHNKLVKQIMELNPLVVGFGSLYPELKETGDIIALLDKAGRKFPVIIGGQMVSPIPEFAVKVTKADFGVVGEGEITLYKLVSDLRNGRDPSGIKGLVSRNGDTILYTGPGDYIEDLSNLPAIPYELFPEEQWLPLGLWYAEHCPQPHWKVEDRVINVHGGRGCPFECNFCYHHSKARYRAIPQMMADAVEALDRFKGNMLYFSDDLVLASPKRAKQLVEAIGALDRPIEYSISARFDILSRLDDQLLYQMKETGCRIMGLGIESGSDRILNIIGKNCKASDIWDGLERLKKVGILPTVSIMVGQHTETKEDVEASIRLMSESLRSNPAINYSFTIMTPFPGSPLYNHALETGQFRDHQDFYDRYFYGSSEFGKTVGNFKQVVNLSAMSHKEVYDMHQKILRLYEGQRPRHYKRKIITLHNAKEIFCKLPFYIDKIMLVEDKKIAIRCVSEIKDNAMSFEQENYVKYINNEVLDFLFSRAVKPFPEIVEEYANQPKLRIQPYSRPNFPNTYQTDKKRFQWYIITNSNIPEGRLELEKLSYETNQGNMF